MRGDCMICTATCGNGVAIGWEIIQLNHKQIHRVLQPVPSECFGAAVGTATLHIAGQVSVTVAIQTLIMMISASDWLHQNR
jgi:hypothetical protein